MKRPVHRRNLDFPDRFRSAYVSKLLTAISALRREYEHAYRFIFDDQPEPFRDGTLQGRFSLVSTDMPGNGPHSFKFIAVARLETEEISITSISYDAMGRGLDGRRSMFFGSLDDFRNLDLKGLIRKRLSSAKQVRPAGSNPG